MSQPAIHGPASETVAAHLPAKRAKSGAGYAEGTSLAAEALLGAWHVEAVFIDSEFATTDEGAELIGFARKRHGRLYHASSRAMAKLSSVDSPPPVGVVVRPPEPDLAELLATAERLLVLDRVADPGNAGALIRSAVAFGATVLTTRGSVGLTNDKLIRASAGTCFHPRAAAAAGEAGDLARQLTAAGWTTATLDPRGGTGLQAMPNPAGQRIALVLGNEANGVDWAVWRAATRIRIEMLGRVESLNVSISGAIALYELACKSGQARP